MICPECIKKDRTLQKISQAYKDCQEAEKHYQKGTYQKAEADGKAIHFDELMKGLDVPSAATPSCEHAEELQVLRNIARVAGEWGIAMAELNVAPSQSRRNKAANSAREMSNLLGLYKQMQCERN